LSWYKALEEKLETANEILPNREYINGFYGLDAKQGNAATPLRDWNEEYQQCKELPKGNLLQRIQRKRTI
jgi:hypothetical protein